MLILFVLACDMLNTRKVQSSLPTQHLAMPTKIHKKVKHTDKYWILQIYSINNNNSMWALNLVPAEVIVYGLHLCMDRSSADLYPAIYLVILKLLGGGARVCPETPKLFWKWFWIRASTKPISTAYSLCRDPCVSDLMSKRAHTWEHERDTDVRLTAVRVVLTWTSAAPWDSPSSGGVRSPLSG